MSASSSPDNSVSRLLKYSNDFIWGGGGQRGHSPVVLVTTYSKNPKQEVQKALLKIS